MRQRLFKISVAALMLVLVLGLCACKSTEAKWQEQYDLGMKYVSEGNYEEAIIAFAAAIEIDPNNADAYIGRADAYVVWADTERSGDEITDEIMDWYQLAEADYLSVLEAEPENAEIYKKLFELYRNTGDTDKAADILQDGIDACGPDEELLRLAEELGYELDENGRLVSEEEKLAAMTPSEQVKYYLDQEAGGQPLFPGNITLFDQDIHEITLDDVLSIAGANGWDNPNYLTSDSFTDFAGRLRYMVRYNMMAPSGWSNVSAFQTEDFLNAGYICFEQLSFGAPLTYYGDNDEVREKLTVGIPVGMFDLCTGDSLETALEKMGLSPAVRGEALSLSQFAELEKIPGQISRRPPELLFTQAVIVKKNHSRGRQHCCSLSRRQKAHQNSGQSRPYKKHNPDSGLVGAVLKCPEKSAVFRRRKGHHRDPAQRPGQHIHTGGCRQSVPAVSAARHFAPQSKCNEKPAAQTDHGKGPGVGIFQNLQLFLLTSPGGNGVRSVSKSVQMNPSRHKNRNQCHHGGKKDGSAVG